MLEMIRSLYAHQAWADASLIGAIRKHEAAERDENLRKTLHHMDVVQRAFLALFLKQPFDFAGEMRTPDSIADVERVFRETHVVMHSQHHRGQCAARPRALGGEPPTVDFIIWLKNRPAAWS